jgi:hypothetical protein
MRRSSLRPISILLIAMAALPTAAWADAIDGDWCFADGKHLSIEGPRIVTPGGTTMNGDYDRHGFAYVVPVNEPGAGSKVTMILLDEETMQLQLETAGGKPQTWRRCKLTT